MTAVPPHGTGGDPWAGLWPLLLGLSLRIAGPSGQFRPAGERGGRGGGGRGAGRRQAGRWEKVKDMMRSQGERNQCAGIFLPAHFGALFALLLGAGARL